MSWWAAVARGAAVAALAAACAPTPAAPLEPRAATAPRTTPTAVPVTPTPAPAARTAVVVDAAEQYFYPEQVTISAGTTVLWRDVQGTHDMVADDRTFASAVLFEGGTYSFTFTRPGVYRYVCTLHVGAGMWGEIAVSE
jgi:plastocyanin